jgi:long-chain fatty acid transport protein
MLGLGGAYRATDKLMLVADYKWINWKSVMKDFKMTFTADATQPSPLATGFGLGGQVIDATLFQNWKDQNVFMLGAAYRTTEELTLRAGLNIANNPIPSKYENPLFPAIVKNHIMVGAGYAFDAANSVDASLAYAPEVKVTNGSGITTKHSQNNAQIMYSHRF